MKGNNTFPYVVLKIYMGIIYVALRIYVVPGVYI